MGSYIQELMNYISELTNHNDIGSAMILAAILSGSYYFVTKKISSVGAMASKHLTTTLRVDSSNSEYYVIMRYLAEKGIAKKLRTVTLSNDRWGDKVVSIGNGTHYTKINNRYFKINISSTESGNTVIYTATLTTVGRSQSWIEGFMTDISLRQKNLQLTQTEICIADNDSTIIINQRKTKLGNSIIDPITEKKILKTLDEFINSKQWYKEKDIPHTLGILFYGPPGTGKTSLIRGIASYLNRGITDIRSISALNEFNTSYRRKRHIGLIEEVDTFGVTNRKLTHDESKTPASDVGDELLKEMGKGSLRNMLTSLDGIISTDERILIMTTNDKSALDDAMIRPGRIDLIIKLGYLTEDTFLRLLQKLEVMKPTDVLPKDFKLGDNISPADVQGDVLLKLSLPELLDKYKA